MNLQQIEYIIAVKELLHFGLAAQRCFVTQSTLSTMIGRFEDEIGVKIFDRKTKPITITNEGLMITNQLQIILKEVENLEEKVKSMKSELSGELKIGVIPTVAPYILPKFLHNFIAKHPKIHFSISELTTSSILQKLKERSMDLGILATPLHDTSIVEYPLYNEEFVLYDSDKKKASSTVKISEIDFNKFWLLEEGHCFGTQVIKICDLKNRATTGRMNFEFKVGSIDSLMRFVKESSGITFLPYLATLGFSESDAEKVTLFQQDVPVRTISIVTHKHFVKKQILELLKTEIQEAVAPLLRSTSDGDRIITPL